MDQVDVVIIGAGAAGLMAACSIVESVIGSGLSVCVFERQEKPGRKILASGNGRCNLGHSGSLDRHYRGKSPEFVKPVFDLVTQDKYRQIFSDLGVLLSEDETGRLYPRTMRSDTILMALLNFLESRNVSMHYGLEIFGIEKNTATAKNRFLVKYKNVVSSKKGRKNPKQSTGQNNKGQLRAQAVIIATGGKSQPQLSGHDSGYYLAGNLGHSCTELFPALVPVELEDAGSWKRSSGQRVRATAHYRSLSGTTSVPVGGEYLFTDYGVSGIAAMELAETIEKDQNPIKGELVFDLLPEMSTEDLSSFIFKQVQLNPEYSWEKLLIGLLPLDVIIVFLRTIQAGTQIEKTKSGCRQIAGAIKNLSRKVKGTRGYKFAQLTAGGIHTDEVFPESLESKICPRLYLPGEILDINGDTGGYNLRWAFSSAYVAGKSVAAALTANC